MEELTLEQIKKKSELEEDIDFEKGWRSVLLVHNHLYSKCVREKKKLDSFFFLS